MEHLRLLGAIKKGLGSLGYNAFNLCRCSYNKKVKASLTFETILVLPLFMFFILSLCFTLDVLRVEAQIGCALGQVSKDIAQYSYLYELIDSGEIGKQNNDRNKNISNNGETAKNKTGSFVKKAIFTVAGQTYAKSKLIELCGGAEYLNSSNIKDGSNGLNLLLSTVVDRDNYIKLVVIYEVKLPFNIFRLPNIKVIQNASARMWTGYDHSKDGGDENSDRIVYITRTGACYHLRKDCKYIKVQSKQISSDNLDKVRNINGGRYYPCKRCNPSIHAMVYITKYGTSYHSSPKCTAIEKGVMAVRLSEVNGRRCCSYCGGGQ